MLKKGFTLAEVLITLSIIGVIASLTLPALMTNTREQQAKTALKKGINTLTQAANMNAAQFGSDFSVSETSAMGQAEEMSSLAAVFKNQLSLNDKVPGTTNGWLSTTVGGTRKKPTYTTGMNDYPLGQNDNMAVFLQDGSSIIFPKTPGTRIPVIYDTNGLKGPNMISNCKGGALTLASTNTNVKAADTYEAGTNDETTCQDSSRRRIYDQFGLILSGSKVYPNGVAARYAFDN